MNTFRNLQSRVSTILTLLGRGASYIPMGGRLTSR